MVVVSGWCCCGRRSYLVVTAESNAAAWVPWLLARGVVRWEVRRRGDLLLSGGVS